MSAVAKIMCDHACINSSTCIWDVSNIYIAIFRSHRVYQAIHQNRFMLQKHREYEPNRNLIYQIHTLFHKHLPQI